MQQDEGMGLEALTSAILDDARGDAARIVSMAKAEAELNLRNVREEAAVAGQELLERAGREAEQIRRQGIAAANMDAQALILSRREKVLTSILEGARERLKAAPQWSGYDEIVRCLLIEAAKAVDADEMVVRGDAPALQILGQGMLAELEETIGARLHLQDPLEDRAGVIVETTDGRRRYNNTLEARLSRQWDFLRGAVYRILVGERP